MVENSLVSMPQEMEVLANQGSLAMQELRDLRVTDEATMQKASTGIILVRGLIKQAEAIRQKLVKPLNDHVRMINGEIAKTTGPLKEVDDSLSGELSAYRAKLEAARFAEEARLRKLAEARAKKAEETGRPVPVPKELQVAVPPAEKKVETEAGSVTFVKKPDWELQDITKVPAEYLMLNSALITKVVNAGVRDIPGIRIWIKEIPSTRRA